MYSGQSNLAGFFLFDAIGSAAKAVAGAVTGAVKAVTGTGSQTGSTTPVYYTVPPTPTPPATNYTPWLIGGAAIVGAILLTRGKR